MNPPTSPDETTAKPAPECECGEPLAACGEPCAETIQDSPMKEDNQ